MRTMYALDRPRQHRFQSGVISVGASNLAPDARLVERLTGRVDDVYTEEDGLETRQCVRRLGSAHRRRGVAVATVMAGQFLSDLRAGVRSLGRGSRTPGHRRGAEAAFAERLSHTRGLEAMQLGCWFRTWRHDKEFLDGWYRNGLRGHPRIATLNEARPRARHAVEFVVYEKPLNGRPRGGGEHGRTRGLPR